MDHFFTYPIPTDPPAQPGKASASSTTFRTLELIINTTGELLSNDSMTSQNFGKGLHSCLHRKPTEVCLLQRNAFGSGGRGSLSLGGERGSLALTPLSSVCLVSAGSTLIKASAYTSGALCGIGAVYGANKLDGRNKPNYTRGGGGTLGEGQENYLGFPMKFLFHHPPKGSKISGSSCDHIWEDAWF